MLGRQYDDDEYDDTGKVKGGGKLNQSLKLWTKTSLGNYLAISMMKLLSQNLTMAR